MSSPPVSLTLAVDTGVVSHLCRRPGQQADSDACLSWLRQCLAAGATVYLPEICDYELRRELVRAGKTASVRRLDGLQNLLTYLPLTTDAMRHAADLWAQARNNRWATADPKALDGDVILAAQALTLTPAPARLLIATENVVHLSRYATAQDWRTIIP